MNFNDPVSAFLNSARTAYPYGAGQPPLSLNRLFNQGPPASFPPPPIHPPPGMPGAGTSGGLMTRGGGWFDTQPWNNFNIPTELQQLIARRAGLRWPTTANQPPPIMTDSPNTNTFVLPDGTTVPWNQPQTGQQGNWAGNWGGR